MWKHTIAKKDLWEKIPLKAHSRLGKFLRSLWISASEKFFVLMFCLSFCLFFCADFNRNSHCHHVDDCRSSKWNERNHVEKLFSFEESWKTTKFCPWLFWRIFKKQLWTHNLGDKDFMIWAWIYNENSCYVNWADLFSLIWTIRQMKWENKTSTVVKSISIRTIFFLIDERSSVSSVEKTAFVQLVINLIYFYARSLQRSEWTSLNQQNWLISRSFLEKPDKKEASVFLLLQFFYRISCSTNRFAPIRRNVHSLK